MSEFTLAQLGDAQAVVIIHLFNLRSGNCFQPRRHTSHINKDRTFNRQWRLDRFAQPGPMTGSAKQSRIFHPSWPGLTRPSTPPSNGEQDVDHRDEPGDDSAYAAGWTA